MRGSVKALNINDCEVSDPTNPGIALDTPERREVAAVFENAGEMPLHTAGGGPRSSVRFEELSRQVLLGFAPWTSRAEIIARVSVPEYLFAVGDYRRGVGVHRGFAEQNEQLGRIAWSARAWAIAARFHLALGEVAAARQARDKAGSLAERLPEPSVATVEVAGAEDDWRLAVDDDWDRPMENIGPGLGRGLVNAPHEAAMRVAIARICARKGHVEPSIRHLGSVIPAIERGSNWVGVMTRLACDAAETLWLTQRTDWIDVIERNLREKVIAPDFHFPMMDGRLALARLCALQQRYDEAMHWFAKARAVLDEQGARPLRAITDYDEALMYARRGAAGDRHRARPLLEAALAQFRAIGMPGWIRRAEALMHNLAVDGSVPVPAAAPISAGHGVMRAEGDFWTIAYEGRTVRLRHSRGLELLARLLRAPGQEIAATELLVGAGARPAVDARADLPARTSLGDAGELLDAPARAAYKQRVAELRAELDEAEASNDLGRAERLRAELDMLAGELARAVGLGGCVRRAGSHAERARVNATRTLTRALTKIAAQHPSLGEHFARTIRTGTFCSYNPDPHAPIEWET